jgi:hypothetical protein
MFKSKKRNPEKFAISYHIYKLKQLATNKALVVKNPCSKNEKYLIPTQELSVLKRGQTKIIKQQISW